MPETQDWSAPQTSPATLAAGVTVLATEAGVTANLVAPVAGQRVVVVSASVDPDLSATGPSILRAMVNAIIRTTVGVAMGLAGISPQAPHSVVPLAFGAAQTGVGEGVDAFCQTEVGSGAQSVLVSAVYYRTT